MTQNGKKEKENVIVSVMFFATLVLFFYQFIARSAFPTVLTEQFMKYFQIDATGMGVLASCYYWVYTFMQIPAGLLSDRFGPRKISVLSAMMCSCGVLLFVSTTNCYVAGCGQMMLGFGSSFAFILVMKVITSYFSSEEVPVKTSITVAIGCSGPVIGGPAVSALVSHFDWVNLMKVFAIAGLFLAVALGMIVRDKESGGAGSKRISPMDSIKIIMTSSQVWILSLYTMAQYAPLSALGDLWGVSFLKKAYGIDSATASFANNMLYVGMVVGAPTFAYLARIWDSYKKPMIVGIVGAAMSMATIIMGAELPLKAAFFLFFATGFCCAATLAYPLAVMIFPSSIGATVSGFVNMVCMFSGVVLMPLIGYIVNWSWDGTIENGLKVYSLNDFRLGLVSVLVFLLAGFVLSLMIKDRSPREQRSEDMK
ncbi:MAG: MFS transporter [Holosporaceae bacterium]|jgi:MFS family permease|nr:MFS transporter [Holosporaceae bacterium]